LWSRGKHPQTFLTKILTRKFLTIFPQLLGFLYHTRVTYSVVMALTDAKSFTSVNTKYSKIQVKPFGKITTSAKYKTIYLK